MAVYMFMLGYLLSKVGKLFPYKKWKGREFIVILDNSLKNKDIVLVVYDIYK